jgi:hypothetical protein
MAERGLAESGNSADGEELQTRLLLAIQTDDAGAVSGCIELGADVNYQSRTLRPPLIVAAEYGNTGVALRLIEAGAELNITWDHGENGWPTPYEAAANRGIRDLLFEHAESDEDLFPEGMARRCPCPFCGHWDWIASLDNPCPHYVTSSESGDLYDWSDLGDGLRELSEVIDLMAEADGNVPDHASEGVSELIACMKDGGVLGFLNSYPLDSQSAEVDESLYTAQYEDYFHEEPGFRAELLNLVNEALTLLDEYNQ